MLVWRRKKKKNNSTPALQGARGVRFAWPPQSEQPVFLIDNCLSDENDNRFFFFLVIVVFPSQSKCNLEYIYILLIGIDYTKNIQTQP